jgi:hypothetical protein
LQRLEKSNSSRSIVGDPRDPDVAAVFEEFGQGPGLGPVEREIGPAFDHPDGFTLRGDRGVRAHEFAVDGLSVTDSAHDGKPSQFPWILLGIGLCRDRPCQDVARSRAGQFAAPVQADEAGIQVELDVTRCRLVVIDDHRREVTVCGPSGDGLEIATP